MRGNHFFKRTDLENILFSVKDKTLGEVDKNHVFDRTKVNPKITGIAGDVIEQSVLGYPADQAQNPDLDVDGVPTELKTTGMRLKKDGNSYVYEAKEPASITAVSINSIVRENFFSSTFWHKAEHMLFVFYQYESKKPVPAAEYANFHIRGFCFNDFSEEDKLILMRDWQLIHDFIADIQNRCNEEQAQKEYPNLSTIINKQTTYLDTAPKYPHPPRFRLRKRVVTFIIQKSFDGNRFERLPDAYLGASDVEKKCSDLMVKFLGHSMSDILSYFNINTDPMAKAELKQYAEQVIVRMFGGTAKKISKIEMFQKLGYIGKAVTISATGTRTEDTKLLSVDFDELTEEWVEDETGTVRQKEFEDSNLYHYLHDNKMLCAVFWENHPDESGKIRLGDNKFMGFKIIDLSDEAIIEEARRTWHETRELIRSGNLRSIPTLDKHGNQRFTPKTKIPMESPNLPKAENHLIFFRGTGQNANDKVVINGIRMLRQNYWIKGTFLVEKLNSTPIIGENRLCNSDKSKGIKL